MIKVQCDKCKEIFNTEEIHILKLTTSMFLDVKNKSYHLCKNCASDIIDFIKKNGTGIKR
jgi:hypothetical protein